MVISWRLSLSVSFLRIVSECPSCPGTFSPFVLIHVVSLSFKVTLRVLNHIKPTISLETGVSVAHFCFPYCCLVVCLFVLLGTLLWCCCSVAKSYPALCNPVDCSLPGFSVPGASLEEYWSGLPFPSSGDLPNPKMEAVSPALAGGFFATEPLGKSFTFFTFLYSLSSVCAFSLI